MATYFPGSNNQKDAARMFYSNENLPSSYSEARIPGNSMIYLTSASTSGPYSDTLVASSQQQNGCNEVASLAEPDSNPSQHEILSNLGGSRIGFDEFSSWKNGGNDLVVMHPEGAAGDVVLQGAKTLQGQGLSLSLATTISPGFQMSSLQYGNSKLGVSSFSSADQLFSGRESDREGSFADNDDYQSKRSRQAEYTPPGFPGGSLEAKTYISPYRISSIARILSNSKYLMVVQQLLDEVVNVREALKEHNSRKELIEMDGVSKKGISDPTENGASANPQDSNIDYKSEPSTAEKQELQSKLTKLLSMFNEVDSRYKQYYHQMQIMVSSFDVVAGSGAAKPYTAVALRTISRHFRCLRDAIKGQILMTRKNLGDQDASSNIKGVGISRLRYVDQQLRQQRALQQSGLLQPHAWRPQRGLPENAVTILRAWLFEHFLHPYPKDSDKSILARQTGLTRSQVSNWFINARVRLWKPMVEEMYKQELGHAEMDSIASEARKHDIMASEDKGEDVQQSSSSTAMEQRNNEQIFGSKSDQGFDAEIGAPNANASFQNVSNRNAQNEFDIGKKRDDQRTDLDGRPSFRDSICQSNGISARFIAAATAAYDMSELERFGTGDGVSLTLRLQHHVEGSLPMSVTAHHSFVTMRGDDGYNTASPSMPPETANFDCTDSGNRQHHFGPSQLLHDFVA